MVVALIYALAFSYSFTCHAMHKEEPATPPQRITPEESRNNKIRFIRDTFTTEETWDYCFSQKTPTMLIRTATTHHDIPAPPLASQSLIKTLLTFAQKKGIPSATPIITYEHDTIGNFVACKDKSIHLISIDNTGSLTHTHYPLCHNNLITGLAMISPEWLAVAGGNTISFCNIKDRTIHRDRALFLDESISISAITEKHGTLRLESTAQQQYIVYPYDAKLYKSLHGHDLSDWELEIVMRAAYAIHKQEQLKVTLEENDTFQLLPKPLQSLIDYFLILLDRERQKNRGY